MIELVIFPAASSNMMPRQLLGLLRSPFFGSTFSLPTNHSAYTKASVTSAASRGSTSTTGSGLKRRR
jgi:hypothetical protein